MHEGRDGAARSRAAGWTVKCAMRVLGHPTPMLALVSAGVLGGDLGVGSSLYSEPALHGSTSLGLGLAILAFVDVCTVVVAYRGPVLLARRLAAFPQLVVAGWTLATVATILLARLAFLLDDSASSGHVARSLLESPNLMAALVQMSLLGLSLWATARLFLAAMLLRGMPPHDRSSDT